MTKYFLTAALFLLFSFIVYVQKNPVEYGFHGGLTFNYVHVRGVAPYPKSGTFGCNIGGHVKVNTTRHIGFRAILQYEQNGWAYRSLMFENVAGNGLAKREAIFKSNYLTLPVLAESS